MPKKQIWFKGNKAAEKYTEEIAYKLFEDAYQILKNDPEIYTENYLKIMCEEQLKLPLSSYDYLLNIKFKKELVDYKKRIDGLLEQRIMLAKQMYPGIAAMALKNKHKWVDKYENSVPELEVLARLIQGAVDKAQKHD